MMQKLNVIGLMSGTSLDGLDMAFCSFEFHQNKWRFELTVAETIPYSPQWKQRLGNAPSLCASDLAQLDFDFGHFMAQKLQTFIQKNNLKVDLISSHGHTVFHQPKRGFTVQIGKGSALAAQLNCPVIYDFRSQDVALGGQGAPLVPIGDEFLFGEFDACLNLGGIANISMNINTQRKAWDITFCNMALNFIANMMGAEYDAGGEMAAKGKINVPLLHQLNALEYYKKNGPKSLGREGFEKEILPLLAAIDISLNDVLCTLNHHIAAQIADSVAHLSGRILVTGGGAYNAFLLRLLKEKSSCEWIVPSNGIVDFKEALIFAFLGYLRLYNKTNVLASVTGACKDHSSGSIINKAFSQ